MISFDDTKSLLTVVQIDVQHAFLVYGVHVAYSATGIIDGYAFARLKSNKLHATF